MIRINTWFNKNTRLPFSLIVGTIILLQSAFVIYFYQRNYNDQLETVQQLTNVASMGISQKNRELIEHSFSLAFTELEIKAVLLCYKNKLLINNGTMNINCANIDSYNGLWERVISIKAVGERDYTFYYLLSRFTETPQLIFMLLLSCLFAGGCIFLIRFIQHKLKQDIFAPLADNFNRSFNNNHTVNIKEIYDLINKSKKIAEMEKSNAVAEAICLQNSQIAHDIRSPLAALNMIIKDISSIPEEKRVIIRSATLRINDIANNLLDKKILGLNLPSTEDGRMTVELIANVLDTIITEKRVQFRSKIGIEIERNPTEESYGLFGKIQLGQFNRIISNIINNSVDAMKDAGKILIDLSTDQLNVTIRIRDNGKGIPSEILDKLGQKGFSYGKESSVDSGSGLGLYHAINTLREWKGDLELFSTPNQGTTVLIKLPRVEGPAWFVPCLNISNGHSIVIVDDDPSIHNIWQSRFESFLSDKSVRLFNFTAPDAFITWYKSNTNTKNVTFLIDHEFLGHKMNGLDIIKKLNIEKDAKLVTSRFDDQDLLNKCVDIGLGLIPKSMAWSIPIFKTSNAQKGWLNVFIDDDPLTRLIWESTAKKSNIKLKMYDKACNFIQDIYNYDPDETTIYIDSLLGEGIKGEVVAKQIFEKGFKNIILATGFEKENFTRCEWIKGVIGKEPPWET